MVSNIINCLRNIKYIRFNPCPRRIDGKRNKTRPHRKEVLDFHEICYSDKSWDEYSKEATAFSPESLAKAILSADVIKYIGRCIKGEHSYKANTEMLTDKVYWLIENGLNDTIAMWNESKAIELQKYVKSQKRAGKKVKKTSKKGDEVTTNVVVHIVSNSAVTDVTVEPIEMVEEKKAQ